MQLIMDRRIRKTRKAIYQSLVDLLHENDLDNLTVQAIADKADINRVTFYAHFHDKYAAFTGCCHDFISYLFNTGMNLPRTENILNTFTRIKAHNAAFQLLGSGKNSIYFDAALLEWIEKNIREKYHSSKYSLEEQACLVSRTYTIFGLMKWYGAHCNEYTPQEITDRYLAILKPIEEKQ